MRKPLPLFFLLLFGACHAKTNSFVVRALQFSEEDAPLTLDLDQDGLDDNQLPQWNAAWRILGFPVEDRYQVLLSRGEFSLGFDLIEESLTGVSLRGYRASFIDGPHLDGSDLITPVDETFPFEEASLERPLFGDEPGFLEATGERFFWPLLPFQSQEPLELPLLQVSISGALQGSELTNGRISGLVPALAVAATLEKIPAVLQRQQELDARAYNNGDAPIPCEGDESHAALVCLTERSSGFCADANPDGLVTGLCLGPQSISARMVSFLDDDGDGRFAVDFNEREGRFQRNELARLFTLNPETGAPEGLFGDLFQIDQDQDGVADAMAVALGFEAIAAQRK